MRTLSELEKIITHGKKTIAIDFDGVVHKYSNGFKDGTIYDEPTENIKEALELLSKKFTLVIFTCRADPDNPLINGKSGKEQIYEWLVKYNLVNYISNICYEKPRAKYYIDDRGITFTNWKNIIYEILTTQS